MRTIDTLLRDRPGLDLDGLVAAANEILPQHLPAEVADARITEKVNARLVRHYTSEGLLEPPLKEGRHARYTVDHLLQLLALRRLLAEGVPASTIGDSLRHKEREELRAILEGGARFDVAPFSGSALDFLGNIKRRTQAKRPPGPTSQRSQGAVLGLQRGAAPKGEPASKSTPAEAPPSSWERYPLLDGVELHVRSDVKVPSSPAAQQSLLDHITRLLIQIAQRRLK